MLGDFAAGVDESAPREADVEIDDSPYTLSRGLFTDPPKCIPAKASHGLRAGVCERRLY